MIRNTSQPGLHVLVVDDNLVHRRMSQTILAAAGYKVTLAEGGPQALAAFDRRLRHGPREFSWFIYRITTPTLRDLFMGPKNALRMKEALLSVLAGDIFGHTPIWRSVFAFKVLYYAYAALRPRRSWQAWQRRRQGATKA